MISYTAFMSFFKKISNKKSIWHLYLLLPHVMHEEGDLPRFSVDTDEFRSVAEIPFSLLVTGLGAHM